MFYDLGLIAASFCAGFFITVIIYSWRNRTLKTQIHDLEFKYESMDKLSSMVVPGLLKHSIALFRIKREIETCCSKRISCNRIRKIINRELNTK